LRKYGQEQVETAAELTFMRSQLRLAPTLAELEPELAASGTDVSFIGHTVDRTEEEDVPEDLVGVGDGPVGFVYLSVTGLDPPMYADVLTTAFRGTGTTVVCAVGYHYGAAQLPDGTAEVRFVRYVPAHAVLKRSDFVIFHAGHDTMMSVLYHGIPSLAFPQGSSERLYNAAALERIGAGIWLPFAAFRPRRILKAVHELTSGRFAPALERFSARLHQAGGCEEAVAKILQLAKGDVQAQAVPAMAARRP
jgi:hypothetical protein